MKILVVTSMFPTTDNPAFGIFVREQVDSLRRKGVEIDVLFIEGYKSKWNYLKSVWPLYRKVLTGRYDLVHSHYGLNGWVGRMQFILPLVVTFHGDDILGTPVWNGKELRYSLTSRLLVGLNKILARLSRAVIVQSGEMRKVSGYAGAKVIPCGVDFQVFQPIDRITACRQAGLDPAKKYVLFPANPAIPVKNFSLAKDAFDRVKQQIPDLELITFARQIPRRAVVWDMNAADVMLFTSLHEGAGLVVKEAMACNLPVVSVDVGDVREVISGVDNCYVTSRNAQEMADRALDVLKSGRRSNGRKHIARYEISNIADKIIGVYNSL